MAFEVIALVCAAFFAGASTYITFIEHPARLSCGPTVALAQWRPSYQRATVMQASLAVIGLVSAVVAYWLGRGLPVLVGGLFLGAVVPFTLLVILPTNKRLLDPSLHPSSSQAAELLRRWGHLHAARTVAGIIAFGVLLARIIGLV
jgi:Domain of unknown function (DUF1772)